MHERVSLPSLSKEINPFQMFRRPRRNFDPFLYAIVGRAVAQYAAIPNKSLITLGIIAANVVVFYRPGALDALLPTIPEVCLKPNVIIRVSPLPGFSLLFSLPLLFSSLLFSLIIVLTSNAFFQDWNIQRLLLSAFYHMDEVHLVYNMISLLWKGHDLEKKLGTVQYGITMPMLLFLSQGFHVFLSRFFSRTFSWHSLYHQCAIGFSSVLFAMKTILNAGDPNYSIIHGIMVPTKFATWAELIFIQFLVPNASFMGHLSGILAGIAFLNISRMWIFFGRIFKGALGVARHFRLLKFPGEARNVGGSESRGGRTAGRSTSRSTTYPPSAPEGWTCNSCTFLNPPSTSNLCEACGNRRGADPSSRFSTYVSEGSPYAFENYVPTDAPDSIGSDSWHMVDPPEADVATHLPRDELRARRLERFSRQR